MRVRVESKLVLPQGLVLALLFVGLNRLLALLVLARMPPNPEYAANAAAYSVFWEFLLVHHGGLASIQHSLMTVNALLVVLLWAQFRGLPRGSFYLRSFHLATFGGAAALLAYLQYCLALVWRIEPAFRLIRLDPASGLLTVP